MVPRKGAQATRSEPATPALPEERLERDIEAMRRVLDSLDPKRQVGKVIDVVGLVVESFGPSAKLQDACVIQDRGGHRRLSAEVVGFREGRVLLMPLGTLQGIGPGSLVMATRRPLGVKVGEALLGRILDGLGEPLDGKGPVVASEEVPLEAPPPNPLSRRRITEPLPVGIRAIDGLLTLGKGQRIGIFSGSGVGKSTLLGMMARHSTADVNVIALVGERGREVREFIERDLGEGLQRSVVVVATSDQPPLIRVKAAMTATAVAEYFRDKGLDVLLVMDSITRFAMAQREIGLAVGEPPTTRGYTPSVFALLPRLLERAGTARQGSITGIYTVLVEGDDMNEPIADAARSILDGHIVLSRDLANRGHYPPVDVLASVSRLMTEITTAEHQRLAMRFRSVLAAYTQAEDLINIGAYVHGSNPRIDEALMLIDRIRAFLRQGSDERATFEETLAGLATIFGEGAGGG